MQIEDITDVMPTDGSNGMRHRDAITYAVVHHAAVPLQPYSPKERFKQFARHHIDKGWKRCAYHYAIGADGKVYKLNDEEEITWHAGNYAVNVKGIGILVDGDWTKDRLPSDMLAALWDLLVHLTTERPDMPNLVEKTVKTHREVRLLGGTKCPSKQIQKAVEAFRSWTKVWS